MQVICVLKHESHHVPVRSTPVDARRYAKRFDSAQVKLPLLAEETTIQSVTLFRPPMRPRPTDSRNAQADRRAAVPVDFDARLQFTHQLQETGQQRSIPLHALADGKTLLAEVPALAIKLPRHHVFGLGP